MKWLTERVILLGFGVVLAVLLVNGLLSYRDLKVLMENNHLVSHTYEVITELESLLSSMKDAETGQRGFLLTGEESYLRPYTTAMSVVDTHLQRAARLTADNPRQRERIPVVRDLITRERNYLVRNIEARRSGGLEAARVRVLSGEGMRLMDSLRRVVAAMEHEEQGLLAMRTSDAEASGSRATFTFLLTSILGIALVSSVYYLTLRDIRQRRRNEEALQAAHNALEQRVEERTSELARANRVLNAEVAERMRTEAQLQIFTKELERSNRELQDFAFVASHDLQEPLRKIQAFGDRLNSKFGPLLGEVGQDYLQRMQSAAQRMHVLINDLLTFSRISSKAQPFVAIELGDIIRDVMADLEIRVQQTGGTVEILSTLSVAADPLQMRQLFQNLIGNALKFHRPDVPPVVTVRMDRLDPADGAEPEMCIIAIEDNGIGFDEKYLDRIFTPFQRLHNKTAYEGTGMGLAVCRKIVERHGGSITAQSTPGVGTTFLITLPIRHTQD